MLLAPTQALAAALAALAGAQAEPPPPEPPPPAPPPPSAPIVVTASRTAPPSEAGIVAIDAGEIARLQPASLIEALDEAAGVRVFSTGGIGGGAFVSVRGGEPNFTLVLLDGIKLNDPTNSRGGAFDFGQIDPLLVERVEIARGAVSAVHGSDALSGVVNIRLRAPAPGATRVTARATAGSEGDVGLGAGLDAGWRGGGLLVAGSWFDSGGLDLGSDLERRQALVRIDHHLGGAEARLIGLYGEANRALFPEDSGGPLFAVNRALETGEARLIAGAATLRAAAGAAVRPSLTLSFSEQRSDSATPAIARGALVGVPALAADSRFARFEAIADVALERAWVSATVGAALLREDGRSAGTIDFGFPLPVAFALERSTRSAFAEATLRPAPRVSLTLAGRYDSLAGGPDSWTGRASFSWRPSPEAPALFARIGEGYKLPSFYALGHPLIGNPALRPERSRNLEAGLEWSRAPDRLVRLTVFHNRFRDLIDFDPILFTTVNRESVVARGAELEGRWAVRSDLIFSGALTWLDLDSPTPLRGRPAWQGALRMVWQASADLALGAAVRAYSSFNDSSIPTGPVVAQGHAEADLTLRYRMAPRLTLDAALRNLADSRHQDAVGFPAPGRLLRATLSAAF